MEADAEIVQVPAQLQLVGAALETIPLANLEVLLETDVIPLVLFERFAHPLPGGGQPYSDMREALELSANGVDHVIEPAVGVEIDGQDVSQIRESRAQAAGIDVARPVLLLVLHDEQRAGIGQHLHDMQPIGEIGVLFSVIADENINGASGQEKLVGCVLDLLSAEVPDVDLKLALQDFFPSVLLRANRRVELIADHVDSLGGFFALAQLVIRILDLACQRCLAGASLADDDQLRLTEIINSGIGTLTPVIAD